MADLDGNAATSDVAIIGVAAKLPQCRDVDEFWRRIAAGECLVTDFDAATLAAAGVAPADLASPNYVRRGACLTDVNGFDAGFFGITPRDAQVMDPQLRWMLMLAWEVFERAGCDVDKIGANTGVFTSASTSTYLHQGLSDDPAARHDVGFFKLLLGNDKDHVATTLAFRLNLQGPSINVGCGCSSSLFAVHLACQNLLTFQCDYALAGGVSIFFPHPHGYFSEAEGIYSPDGHCHPFDVTASGTVAGNGAGLVLLKRLDDALRDNDPIVAVIKGSATNNDGRNKVGYTAPSAAGQQRVIEEALAVGGIDPKTVEYVEAHGTGTALGDAIEIEALRNAFGARAPDQPGCALGSVKYNIGHLDAASGVAGLIKASLSLHHATIPPSPYFTAPGRAIALDDTPFFINPTALHRGDSTAPLRAGVSSFGMGGSNVHVVLEQHWDPALQRPAARRASTGMSHTFQLKQYRFTRVGTGHAESPGASERTRSTGIDAALQALRRGLADRSTLPRDGVDAALRRYAGALILECFGAAGLDIQPRARLELSAIGAALEAPPDYAGLLAALVMVLVEENLVAAQDDAIVVAAGAAALPASQALLYAATEEFPRHERAFVCLQHCIDACRDVFAGRRGGGAVLYPRDEPRFAADAMASLAPDAVASARAVAACIPGLGAAGPGPIRILNVIDRATPGAVIDALASGPRSDAVEYATVGADTPDATPFAAHSVHFVVMHGSLHRARDPRRLLDFVAGMLHADGLLIAVESPCAEFWCDLVWGLEPSHWDAPPEDLPAVLAHCGLRGERASLALGSAGAELAALVAARAAPRPADSNAADREPVPRRWLYAPDWQMAAAGTPPPRQRVGDAPLLWIGAAPPALDAAVDPEAASAWRGLVRVSTAAGFRRESARHYAVNPEQPDDFARLMHALAAEDSLPQEIVYALPRATGAELPAALRRDYLGVVHLARALGATPRDEPYELVLLTQDYYPVLGDEAGALSAAAAVAAGKLVPGEYANVHCRQVDLGSAHFEAGAAHLLARIAAEPDHDGRSETPVVAYRGKRRFLPTYRRIEPRADTAPAHRFEANATYLVSGGLGAIGLAVVEHVVETSGARVAIVSRRDFPPAADWPAIARGDGDPALPDRTRQAVVRLQRLRAQGASLRVFSADVSDARRLEQVRAGIETDFGRVAGIVHCAGVIDTHGVMHRRSVAALTQPLAAKVAGTLALARVFGDRGLRFMVLCSTLGTVLYKLKFSEVGYLAANEFLDRYAESAAARPFDVITINWTDWKNEGMAAAAADRFAATYADSPAALLDPFRGLDAAEGKRMLALAMSAPDARVVVSTQNLDRLVAQHAAFDSVARASHLDALGLVRKGQAAAAAPAQRDEGSDGASVQERIARIWRNLLGVEALEPDDDFFDLGGDSLLALRLIARLKDNFGVELTLLELYDLSTVRLLAGHVAQSGGPAQTVEVVI